MAGKMTKKVIARVVMLNSGATSKVMPIGQQRVDLFNRCALLGLPGIAGLHQFAIIRTAIVVMDAQNVVRLVVAVCCDCQPRIEADCFRCLCAVCAHNDANI